MSAPYSIVDQYHHTLVKLAKHEPLQAAIDKCRAYRKLGERGAHILGDDVSPDCPTGLSRDEQLEIEAAGV